ncbi:MAG: phage holin family protein [Nonlabens sp.]|nr:phage holin family protein [Nonlabens sp.]
MSQSITDRFNELINATQEYIDATIAFQRLDLYKKVMQAASSTVHKVFVGFVLLLGLIFLSVALAIYLGTLTNSIAAGYAIVGLLYIILCICIMYFLRPSIERIMLQRSSKKLFNKYSNSQSNQSITQKDTYENL